MNNYLFRAFCLAVVLCLGACSQPVPKEPYKSTDPGWQLYPTPRTFDGVGTVFSLDSKSVMRPEGLVEPSGQDLGGSEQVPKLDLTRKWNPKVLLKYLGLPETSLNVGADVVSTVTLDFSDVKRKQYVFDQAIGPGLRRLNLSLKPGYRYFVIEAIRTARSAKINVDSDKSFNAALQGVAGTVGVEPKLSGSDRSVLTLDRAFATDHNVLFLCREITKEGLGGAPGSNIKLGAEYAREVEWVAEDRPRT